MTTIKSTTKTLFLGINDLVQGQAPLIIFRKPSSIPHTFNHPLILLFKVLVPF